MRLYRYQADLLFLLKAPEFNQDEYDDSKNSQQ